MRAQIYTRIDDVPEALWESIAPPDFFFRRAFLRVMDDSRVENARYRYLVLLEDEAPVGLAVLSRFVLKLDLLSGDPWISRLRRWLPRALDVPMICCGIPASFGQHHLHWVRPEVAPEAVEHVHRGMEEWAEETGCGLLVWKEWSPAQALRDRARACGYLVLPTLPDHVVAPLPDGVGAFLDRLRSSYRRKYRAAARLMDGAGPVWTSGRLRLEERPFTATDEFHQGYRSVMERTRVRLETYPEAFFSGLARAGLDARTLRLDHEGNRESVTALLIPGGAVLTFALIAKDRPRYDESLYTLLLQCIVLYAVHRGFKEVRLGQTSSYAKCSIGAAPRRLETFIRVRAPLKHRALRWFGGLLFPEVDTPRLHVFKEHLAPAAPAAGEGQTS